MIDIVDKLNGAEVLNINTCREAADEITRLRAELEGGDVVYQCPRCATSMQVDLSSKPAPVVPQQHCQNGRADICLAGSRDGICCPEDDCDIDDGLRKPAPVVPECEWLPDDSDPDEATGWESSCGKSWVFCEGGPQENDQNYCGNCGGKVLLSAAKEPQC
jgi:DNA-directed RNA polymerase subunit RPC12/RpoP